MVHARNDPSELEICVVLRKCGFWYSLDRALADGPVAGCEMGRGRTLLESVSKSALIFN